MNFNAILNGGMGLGGGIGAMPVAAPYTTGGLVPGALMQGGKLPGVFGAALPSGMRQDMLNALPAIGGALGGAGVGAGLMAMQPKPDETPQQTQPQATNEQYAPFGGDKAGGTEYAMFGGDQPINEAAPQPAPTDAEGMSKSDMFRLASSALQGMNRQQAFPSGNTAQIMRDPNQFRFAGFQGTPQQQMANALRNRG